MLDYERVSFPVPSAVHVMLARAAAEVGKRVLNRVVVTNFEAALRVVRPNLAICGVQREEAEASFEIYCLRYIPLNEPRHGDALRFAIAMVRACRRRRAR